MKHFHAFLIALFVSFTALAQNGNFVVTVQDAVSGKIITGARVFVLKGNDTLQRAETDISGKAMAGAPAGTYTLVASLRGTYYNSIRSNQALKAGEITKVVMWLTPKSTASSVADTVIFTDKSSKGSGDVVKSYEEVSEKTVIINSVDRAEYMKAPAPLLSEVTVASGKKSSSGRHSSRSKSYAAAYSYGYTSTASDGESPSYDMKSKDIPTSSAYAASPSQPSVTAGMLTAGEINDFGKWKLWKDISNDQLKSYTGVWNMTPKYRYSVQVTNEASKPLVDAKVELLKDRDVIWTSHTDNTGKAELWAGMFGDSADVAQKLNARITWKGKSETIQNIKKFHDGINTFSMKVKCDQPAVADIVFMVDATGSMGDEIRYLQAELSDVMEKEKKKHSDVEFRLGSVFYRDKTDEYLTRKSDLSSDISKTISFMSSQSAGGGGDFPEAVDDGLEECLNNLKWSENACARILFMVLDAPPHNYPDNIKRLQELTLKAAEKGIRIVPVTASGIDKSTEYLMRTFALATNGTYVFLTDHSGIGNHHIEPTTDKYDVEKLNDVLIRVIDTYTNVPKCEEPLPELKNIQDTLLVVRPDTSKKDTAIARIDTTGHNQVLAIDTIRDTPKVVTLRCYPNPTSGPLTIELEQGVKEVFIADITGKLMRRYEINGETKLQIDISEFATGIYYVQCPWENDKWLTGKIVLVHEYGSGGATGGGNGGGGNHGPGY